MSGVTGVIEAGGHSMQRGRRQGTHRRVGDCGEHSLGVEEDALAGEESGDLRRLVAVVLHDLEEILEDLPLELRVGHAQRDEQLVTLLNDVRGDGGLALGEDSRDDAGAFHGAHELSHRLGHDCQVTQRLRGRGESDGGWEEREKRARRVAVRTGGDGKRGEG